jgi:hypothetical protein
MKQSLVANTGELMKNAVISDSLYGNVTPTQTYDSGVSTGGNTRNLNPAKKTNKGPLLFDPIAGKSYYFDTATGEKIYV